MEHKHMLILVIGLTTVSAVAILVFLIMICYCYRKKSVLDDVAKDMETHFEGKERRGEGLGDIIEELIRFEGAEDLSVNDILEAPGEVIGKSSYGTLYRASLLTPNSLALLRFLRPACTLRMKELLPVIELLGSLRHPNLVPLCAFYAGPRGEKLMVHPFFRLGSLAQLIRG